MKKRIIGFLLAIAMVVSTTGCSIPYKTNMNQKELEEAEEEIREKQEEGGEPSESNDGSQGGAQEGAQEGAQDGAQQEVIFSIDLNTVDAYGNTVDKSIVSGARVVMINFWEPWCGPCVGEIPDLELIYENYKDQGLVIIGAYTSDYMVSDIVSLIETDEITYPVVQATQDMYDYMSDYVPTTVFFDSEGNMLDDGQFIGARSYDDWQEIVEKMLESVN